MPTITRIAQQKDKNRVNIYLDGKFAFGITIENLLLNNLHVNKELSQEEVNKLKEQDSQAKIINRAIEFASRRPRSQKEVEQWCYKKKIDADTETEVVKKLTKLNLINDLEFAKWWIDQRNTFRPKPQKVIKLELRQKGVAGDVVEEALGQTEIVTEIETARKVIVRRVDRYKRMPYEEGKKRLSSFLAMRGFSWDTIKKILEESLKK